MQSSLGPSHGVEPSATANVRRVAVIFNPVAGRRRRRLLLKVLGRLKRAGVVATLHVTQGPGDAERIARDLGPAAADRVVVAGGDGTIAEVVNGLAASRLPLAIVPLGTANVLAREIGLGFSPRAVAGTILAGQVRRKAAGRATGGDGSERRFVLMAGVGFDAGVVAALDPRLKRSTGRIAYALAFFSQWLRHHPQVFEPMIDGQARRAHSLIVAKARCYAGPFVVAPAARLDAPSFEVVLFERGRRRDILRYALALFTGRLAGAAGITTITATRVEISGPAGAPVHGDGDLMLRLPATFTVEPDAWSLVVPH